MGRHSHNYLRVSLLKYSEVGCSDRPEFLITEIRFESASSLLLGVVYRPPNIRYLDEFQNQFFIFKLIIGTLLFLET